jgi:hypothetical protein
MVPTEIFIKILQEAIRTPPINVKWNLMIEYEFLQGFKRLPVAGLEPSYLFQPDGKEILHALGFFQRKMLCAMWRQIVDPIPPMLLIEAAQRDGVTTLFVFALQKLLDLTTENTTIALYFISRREMQLFEKRIVKQHRVRLYCILEVTNAHGFCSSDINIIDANLIHIGLSWYNFWMKEKIVIFAYTRFPYIRAQLAGGGGGVRHYDDKYLSHDHLKHILTHNPSTNTINYVVAYFHSNCDVCHIRNCLSLVG